MLYELLAILRLWNLYTAKADFIKRFFLVDIGGVNSQQEEIGITV